MIHTCDIWDGMCSELVEDFGPCVLEDSDTDSQRTDDGTMEQKNEGHTTVDIIAQTSPPSNTVKILRSVKACLSNESHLSAAVMIILDVVGQVDADICSGPSVHVARRSGHEISWVVKGLDWQKGHFDYSLTHYEVSTQGPQPKPLTC